MTVLRKKESKFGAPAGIYLGKFLGIAPMKDNGTPRLGRDGKPMEPGIEWQFEIMEDADHDGQFVGQIVGRITSAVPTTKNACGTLMDGLVGRTVSPDEDVDADRYVGQVYKLVIAPGKENPERTQVTQIVQQKVKANGAPKPGTGAPARPTTPAPAAPARPAGNPKPPTRPAPDEKFWVDDGSGADAAVRTRAEIGKLLAEGLDPGTLQVMNFDQSSGWKTVQHFQLDQPF